MRLNQIVKMVPCPTTGREARNLIEGALKTIPGFNVEGNWRELNRPDLVKLAQHVWRELAKLPMSDEPLIPEATA